jgi:hypothetical protein
LHFVIIILLFSELLIFSLQEPGFISELLW